MKTLFIDNQNENELSKIINSYLKEKKIISLDIASAFFTPSGLNLISKEIKKLKEVRILLGSEPIISEMHKTKEPDDPDEPQFTQNILKQKIKQQIDAIKNHRNKMDFTKDNYNLLNNLIEDLKKNKIKVKLYDKNFLHAKAYIFNTKDNSDIVGSSNLTYSGLKANLELNIGSDNKVIHAKLIKWFENLWLESVEINLIEIYNNCLHKFINFSFYSKYFAYFMI